MSGSLPPERVSEQAAQYVVQAGDTLYGIAWRHDLDYRDLARWNHIGSDYALVVGQVLKLHAPPETGPAAPATGQAAAATGQSAAATGQAVAPTGQSAPAAKLPVAPTRPQAAVNPRWVWPTDEAGRPRPVPGGGVLLLGRLGQDVRAASPGRVVYTGSGLRGYGNLIIIKHGDGLLSSYAHNRELLVREGQDVSGGQVIAHMGTGPHGVAALYFEIRVNGKPRDPLKYLSAR